MDTSLFDYELPDAAIAQTPVEPRDASRLLRCDPLEDRFFRDLPDLLRSGDLLVVNRTKVRAARLRGTKVETGGSVEVLLLRRADQARWEALIRPARRIRRGTAVDLGPLHGEVLTDPIEGRVTIALRASAGDVEELIAAAGEVPLPPYIHTDLPDPDRYQTVFAKRVGSAAAPTAALHFTPALLEKLIAAGVSITEIELEVGLDTFRPISTARVADHVMHREYWEVPESAAGAIAAARERNGR
ncbi:MAG: S-adenosylmethionine:tRNA ribosyltransferase-isomerase, partial [Acidimicrobiia bacterium]|nr:S-adenosylmethionine:tRNA ribosyltransferase-isomerase [Acidimicrobiia bacterium]